MLTSGLALAILTSTGFYLIYMKLPARVKAWMVKHSLLTDFVACVLTYMLFGGTVTALFASAFVGIIISIMLAILNNEVSAAALERLLARAKEIRNKMLASITQALTNMEQKNA